MITRKLLDRSCNPPVSKTYHIPSYGDIVYGIDKVFRCTEITDFWNGNLYTLTEVVDNDDCSTFSVGVSERDFIDNKFIVKTVFDLNVVN